MIYKVLPGKDVFEENPGLASDEVFSVCTDRELKFIFFMYDFDSPYAKMSVKQRLDRSLEEAGFRREKGGRWDKNTRIAVAGGVKDRVKKAVANFRQVQRHSNRDRAILSTIDEQIDHIISEMTPDKTSDTKEIKEVLAIIEKLPKILETRTTIMEILRLSEEDLKEDIKSNKELSTLDEMHLEGLL